MFKRLEVDDWKALMDHAIDPYLVWSDLTGFRQFRSPASGIAIKSLPFLVELREPYDPAEQIGLKIPKLFEAPLADGKRTHFVTTGIDVPTDEIDSPLPKLIRNKAVERVQMGFPVSAQARGQRLNLLRTTPSPIRLKSDCRVIHGVMDDGCAFAHDQFRIAGRPETRVVALWDQTPVEQLDPNREPKGKTHEIIPYGREFGKSQLDKAIADNWLYNEEVDEDACYAQAFGSVQHGLNQHRTHGTAVMDLFAGRSDPRACADDKMQTETDAPIVFVQFPESEMTVSNGRWLVTHVLEGLYYIIDVAQRLTATKRVESEVNKIVANLSYGALAGPHDGSGMLTRALDEVSKLRGNLAVVVASGNSRTSYCHEARLLAPKQTKTLKLFIPPDKPFETYVELWFSKPGGTGAKGGRDNNEGNLPVIVAVRPPRGGERKARVRGIECWSAADFSPGASKDELAASIVFAPRVVQGTSGTMALLAIAGAQITGQYVCAPSGLWEIDVTNEGRVSLDLRAWVERDDLRLRHRSQYASFDGEDDDWTPDRSYAETKDTLSNVAGGEYCYSVGGYVNVTTMPKKPVTLASYSGQGHTSEEPYLYACTEEGFGLGGVRVAGTRSCSYTRTSGTSGAAPQAARALAAIMDEAGGVLTAQKIRKMFEKLSSTKLIQYDKVASTPMGQGPLTPLEIPPAEREARKKNPGKP